MDRINNIGRTGIAKYLSMEEYYLNSLIFFFKTQQAMGYKAIDRLLALIDNYTIPDKRKHKMLLQLLRSYGLNETVHKLGQFDFDKVPPIKPPSEDMGDSIIIPTQIIELRILNGVLQIALPLN